MRGHSDKGRRWHQEIDLKLAVTLVREHAAVVVNRRTIRRLYSNKDFRRLILTRDNYTCYFCGLYGDTIDHLLPRAKGATPHPTTVYAPVTCVIRPRLTRTWRNLCGAEAKRWGERSWARAGTGR